MDKHHYIQSIVTLEVHVQIPDNPAYVELLFF